MSLGDDRRNDKKEISTLKRRLIDIKSINLLVPKKESINMDSPLDIIIGFPACGVGRVEVETKYNGTVNKKEESTDRSSCSM